MAGNEAAELLLPILVLFIAAKALGWVAQRFRQPSVVGELVGGVLVGPSVVSVIDPGTEVLRFAAEFGAILLLFEVGLETRMRDMMAVGRSATLVAVIGIVASYALGYAGSVAIARLGWWPDTTLLHVFVGATLTATSVGITARVLADLGALQTPEARIVLGAAVLDDVGGLLILAFVGALAAGDVSAGGIALTAATAIGFLVAAVVVGLVLVAPIFTRIARKAPEMGLAMALAWGLAIALAAGTAGLAPIVGAFAAGLVLAGTATQHDVVVGLRPINAIFVPLFFGTVGALVDVRAALAEPGKVLVVVLVLSALAVVGKLACGLGVVGGEAKRWPVGVGMVPRGEVGLIFALTGLTLLNIPAWMYAAIVLVVLVTTLATPMWLSSLMRRVVAERSGPDVGPRS